MALYRDRGVVVSGFRLGEADKVLTLITEGRGTLRAVAKGLRKTKSRFGGRLEPLTHVNVMVYEGRSLDVIAQVDTLDNYSHLRAVPERLGAGFAVAEAAVRASHEHEPAPRLYRLLTAALAGLDALPPGQDVPPLYLTVFLLRLIDLCGLGLSVECCASCGSTAVGDRFGVAEGGVLCARCAAPASYRVSPSALALLGEVSAGRVAETAIRAGRAQGGPEVAALVRRFVEYHLEVRLRAPSVAAQL